MIERILEFLEQAGLAISLVAVAVIVAGFAVAAWRYTWRFRATTHEDNFNRGRGPRPSGTLSQQFRARVTIKDIDASVPSLTVETEEGRTTTFKIADKKHLEGVSPGDRVDITYTAAVLIAVK